MRSAAIGEDLNAIESHRNVRAIWGEEFFARLDSHTCIPGRDDPIAKGYGILSGDVSDDLLQVIWLSLSLLLPWREPSGLSKVSVVCKPHLWADEKDTRTSLCARREDDPAIEADIPMPDGHANIDQHAVTGIVLKNRR